MKQRLRRVSLTPPEALLRSGYFGSTEYRTAASTLVDIIEMHTDKVAGIKMSLLDEDKEIAVRDRPPADVCMFTGDDFNYVDLIAGDVPSRVGRHSDALLGAFAAIATLASAALQRLDAGDRDGYFNLLGPTQALSRRIFAAPTFYYKTGIAFLSRLNGHQTAFQLVGGLQASRSLPHLSESVRLANAVGALEDPELAASRWNAYLAVNGIDA